MNDLKMGIAEVQVENPEHEKRHITILILSIPLLPYHPITFRQNKV